MITYVSFILVVMGCTNDGWFCMYESFIWNGVGDDGLIGDRWMCGVCVGDISDGGCLWYPRIVGECNVVMVDMSGVGVGVGALRL